MAYSMYVSLRQDDKLALFDMDPITGKLTSQETVAVPGGPAPLAVDPQRRFLYVGRREARMLSSFRIEPRTGGLSHLSEVALESDPCYLATDRSGKFVFSAYYEAGRAAVHAIEPDGVVGGPPVEWLATARGAHCMQADPSNRFVFVPHIAGNGPNAIFQFRFDAQSGHLTPNTPARVSPERPDGPRHFCFHPSKDLLYFSNEQGCSITTYTFDPTAGVLTAVQTVPTLPPGYSGRNSCSQIQITPSGRFLYAPNRGHNSIACFTVDASTGLLTPVGQVPSETVPRAFSLDPTGTFLYAAGLESGRLAAYRIDSATGLLQPVEIYELGRQPMWVMIIRLEE
jgi:6-phosphogluconolactonase